jgi:hypothetical protein
MTRVTTAVVGDDERRTLGGYPSVTLVGYKATIDPRSRHRAWTRRRA